ncbi:MAG TPA: helix-turn-helix domain-containing protein [Thermoplasmata archaeon]|nr:helix-turn-helix domain-containing protein [Thermoplasmata archaeon]
MTTDERESWRVILPQGTGIQAFLQELPGGPSTPPAISRLHPYRSKTTLTRRQNRALRVAYDLGYFAYPRRGSLGDVARALGTGRSATLEILRRATAKLAGRRFGTELKARVGP